MFVRVERLAATLPPADADMLRGQINANRQTHRRRAAPISRARRTIRATLRHEPFDAEAMRAAMAKTRAARQAFDQVIQGVFAAAAQMSPAGRHALADWPPGRKTRATGSSEQANFRLGARFSALLKVVGMRRGSQDREAGTIRRALRF